MTGIINFFAVVGLLIVIFIVVTIVIFYFFRKRKLDKIRIIEYIYKKDRLFSTFNINQAIFKGKKLNYTIGLLEELEKENILAKIETDNIKNNDLWEYKKQDSN